MVPVAAALLAADVVLVLLLLVVATLAGHAFAFIPLAPSSLLAVRLAFAPAPLFLLRGAVRSGEVVVLPRPATFALLTGGLVLPFLVLLPALAGIAIGLSGRAALLVLLAVFAARLPFAVALVGHRLSPSCIGYEFNGAEKRCFLGTA